MVKQELKYKLLKDVIAEFMSDIPYRLYLYNLAGEFSSYMKVNLKNFLSSYSHKENFIAGKPFKMHGGKEPKVLVFFIKYYYWNNNNSYYHVDHRDGLHAGSMGIPGMSLLHPKRPGQQREQPRITG